MVRTEPIAVGDAVVQGVRIDMPSAPVLMLVGEKGFLGCGYFRPDVADKFSHAVAIVSGVSSFEDMLAARVAVVSEAAAGLGIEENMSGAEAATRLA